MKEEVDSPVAFTARYVCGLRCVEGEDVKDPLLVDPLSPFLCGPKGLALAQEELRGLREAQGEGNHLRVPARNRLVDDEVLHATSALSDMGYKRVQVSWFDVDFDEMINLKRRLLSQAGAECCMSTTKSEPAFPLKATSYHTIGLDLSKNVADNLGQSLASEGFDPNIPCIWVLEAVIYYMEMVPASDLLRAMAELSVKGTPSQTPSRLIATCVDQELLAASQSMEPGSHLFAHLWHFDVDQLLAHPEYTKFWDTIKKPRTSKELALEKYGADTYVALYGGAECIFTASLHC
eukprot:gene27114-2340_t